MTTYKKGNRCWYCNSNREVGRDHLKPQSATSAAKGPTVPCCQHCNSVLGAYPFYTDRQRGKRLAYRLTEKLRSRGVPKWTVEEAARDLEGNLLQYILADISKYNRLKERVEWAVNRWGLEQEDSDDY